VSRTRVLQTSHQSHGEPKTHDLSHVPCLTKVGPWRQRVQVTCLAVMELSLIFHSATVAGATS